MGYLKRRISRGRCAERVDAALARQAVSDLGTWAPVPGIPPDSRRQPVFLRFAVDEVHPDSHQTLGVFQAAFQLRDEVGRELDVGRALGPALRWYAFNLTSPDEVPDRAIFWFKSDAAICVRRIWDVVRILSANGRTVWMMRCATPGRIVYEDEHQVAAVPHRTRAWRRRLV